MHALLTNRPIDALHQLANFKTPRRFAFVDDMPRPHAAPSQVRLCMALQQSLLLINANTA